MGIFYTMPADLQDVNDRVVLMAQEMGMRGKGYGTPGLLEEYRSEAVSAMDSCRSRLLQSNREKDLRAFRKHVLGVGRFLDNGVYNHHFYPLVNKHLASTMPVETAAPTRDIVPQPTSLNIDWFRRWIDTIVTESGVDANDSENTVALVTKASMCVTLTANSLMDQNNASWAKGVLRKYFEGPQSSPWGGIELVAGWDVRSVPVMEAELMKFQRMLIEAGRGSGNFRHEW